MGKRPTLEAARQGYAQLRLLADREIAARFGEDSLYTLQRVADEAGLDLRVRRAGCPFEATLVLELEESDGGDWELRLRADGDAGLQRFGLLMGALQQVAIALAVVGTAAIVIGLPLAMAQDINLTFWALLVPLAIVWVLVLPYLRGLVGGLAEYVWDALYVERLGRAGYDEAAAEAEARWAAFIAELERAADTALPADSSRVLPVTSLRFLHRKRHIGVLEQERARACLEALSARVTAVVEDPQGPWAAYHPERNAGANRLQYSVKYGDFSGNVVLECAPDPTQPPPRNATAYRLSLNATATRQESTNPLTTLTSLVESYMPALTTLGVGLLLSLAGVLLVGVFRLFAGRRLWDDDDLGLWTVVISGMVGFSVAVILGRMLGNWLGGLLRHVATQAEDADEGSAALREDWQDLITRLAAAVAEDFPDETGAAP